MKLRTKARVAALQTLFELDLTDHPMGEVLELRSVDNELNDTQRDFALVLIRGVHENTTILDNLISEHAPEWPLDQIAVIDRNILRMALWEVAFYGKTPLKVGINEAVELGKLFGTDSSPRFINGVLGSLAESLDEIRNSYKTMGD
ncbi:MAG: transcription antitermination factor NusB [Chloroflexi bacterium]|jgi:N utilization substance protein B|nr:transcription antitermination factor NusB [Chloroflexota bacterium]